MTPLWSSLLDGFCACAPLFNGTLLVAEFDRAALAEALAPKGQELLWCDSEPHLKQRFSRAHSSLMWGGICGVPAEAVSLPPGVVGIPAEAVTLPFDTLSYLPFFLPTVCHLFGCVPLDPAADDALVESLPASFLGILKLPRAFLLSPSEKLAPGMVPLPLMVFEVEFSLTQATKC